jgi:cytoskeletal protein RodZ
MSTILKALKRLETEPSNSDELPSMSKQTRDQWFAGRTRRRVRILWMLLIVLLLAVSAAGFFWYRIPNVANLFDSSTRPDVKNSTIENNKIVRKIPTAKPKQPNKAVETKSVSKTQKNRQSLPAKDTLKTPPPLRKRRPIATTPKRSPAPVTAKTPIEATQQPTSLPAVQTPRRPASRKPFLESPASEAKPSPPNLADSSYTLQAIAWSKNPTERLAVINGLVVREGDGIEGITVTQIGTNEVIVQKESKLWKLVFQAR